MTCTLMQIILNRSESIILNHVQLVVYQILRTSVIAQLSDVTPEEPIAITENETFSISTPIATALPEEIPDTVTPALVTLQTVTPLTVTPPFTISEISHQSLPECRPAISSTPATSVPSASHSILSEFLIQPEPITVPQRSVPHARLLTSDATLALLEEKENKKRNHLKRKKKAGKS